jgi:hypothetical protein
MKIIKDKLNAKADWNKDNLEDCFKNWIHDRFVSLYASLPSLMISNIWWAHNNVIFKEKMVLPKVTTTLTLSQVVEFKEDPRGQKCAFLYSPPLTMKSHGATLMGPIKGTRQNVEWELFYLSIKIITFTSYMLQVEGQTIEQSS